MEKNKDYNAEDEASTKEDDNMSKLSEYIKTNKELVYSFATKNTPVDKDGRAVITKDDVWRKETEWDKLFKETAGNQ